MRAIGELVRGSVLGTVLGLLAAVGISVHAERASALDLNTYVAPGVFSPACSDWKFDTDPWPGGPAGRLFQYYWSGQSWWWGDPDPSNPVDNCWHNDESPTYWRAVDYGKPQGTAVYYRATIFISSTPSQQYFSTSTGGCAGSPYVSMYNTYGAYAGSMKYWHSPIGAFVDGTSNVTSTYPSGQTDNIRQVGSVGAAGWDGCTSTGPHMHQSVADVSGTGGGVAYRVNPMADVWPMYFR